MLDTNSRDQPKPLYSRDQDCVEKLKLCFRCLGKGHLGQYFQIRVCGLNDCQEVHHRLLHQTQRKSSDVSVSKQKQSKGQSDKCQYERM